MPRVTYFQTYEQMLENMEFIAERGVLFDGDQEVRLNLLKDLYSMINDANLKAPDYWCDRAQEIVDQFELEHEGEIRRLKAEMSRDFAEQI